MIRSFFLSLLFLFQGITGTAQQLQPETLVVLADVVNKPTNTPVENLTPRDLLVKINGQVASVHDVRRMTLYAPKIAILLDVSGSMGQRVKWNGALSACSSIIKNLPPRAEVSLSLFTDNKKLPFTTKFGSTEALELIDALQWKDSAKTMGIGRTALYDALNQAKLDLLLRPGDAVIVVTDGGDNVSKMNEEKLQNSLCQAGVRVYAALLDDGYERGPSEGDALDRFKTFVTMSGGTAFDIGHVVERKVNRDVLSRKLVIDQKDTQRIDSAVSDLMRRITSPYVITLESTIRFGKLEVSVLTDSGTKDKNIVTTHTYRACGDQLPLGN